MSYQALARKWRPRTFTDVVGQQHVVSALANALDHDRVHHAFLFTGTRGVGKTTLARILAKALNCEQGVSSRPCGECSACQAIDEGRFVDLIEVDAASKTKVDDTREMLDNVQYAPTRARYKVYLIDEVHMLSGHSFNALLKTLEEPPPHVKFVLATTDPQKVPVTVLSRCLQFNLRILEPMLIAEQLRKIIEAEAHPGEPQALELLARAADGSMRDALSLLDQGIAYGGGRVTAEAMQAMLGLIESSFVQDLIAALAAADAEQVMAAVGRMGERAYDFSGALDELLLQLHHLSLQQIAPAALVAKQAQQPWHVELAERISAEDLQLYYQIGLIGKRDLPLAPDPRSGFEMVMLRMLAFRPGGGTQSKAAQPGLADRHREPDAEAAGNAQQASPPPAGQQAAAARDSSATPGNGGGPDWPDLVAALPVNGLVRELAMNMALSSAADGGWECLLDPRHEHLLTEERVQALGQALTGATGAAARVRVSVREHDKETPAQRKQRLADARQKQAEQAFQDHAGVQEAVRRFQGTIIQDSIRPADKHTR